MSDGILVGEAVVFALATVRLTALFVVAPVFGQAVVPLRMRIALALVIAFAVEPRLAPPSELLAGGAQRLAFTVLGEALFGLVLGFTTRLVFAGFTLFGEFVSIQGGIGAITTIDPQSGASSGAIPLLCDLLAVAVYLALDGHHALIRASVTSFSTLPIGSGGIGAETLGMIPGLASTVFDLAVRLAAPVTVAMLVSNTALGILGRVVPQLNLMLVQLPAQIALTLFLLGVAGQTLVTVSGREMLQWGERVAESLGAGGTGG